MTPKVTVALAAYNREKYVGASIESVLSQSFEDFELLVVDDHSTDSTARIAMDYASRDSRVRVIVNGANLGQFPNRNRAASLARGRLLKFHDSDDVMYPHCLEVMVRLLDAEPRAGFALSTGWCWPGAPCPMLSTPRMSYQREFLGRGMFMCGPAGALFRTDVFAALGGFEDVGVPSDYWFWHQACARYPVVLLPADLFWYRVHPNQEFESPRSREEAARLVPRVWRLLHAPECPLTAAEREQAKVNFVYTVARGMYRDVRAGRLALAALRWREAGLTPAEWFRYARRPRRDPFAGSPLDSDGEFAVPAWVQAPAQAASSHEPMA